MKNLSYSIRRTIYNQQNANYTCLFGQRQGVLDYQNGDRYEGEVQSGKRHGKGILTYADGRRYEGEFKGDRLHGHGILTIPNGTKIVGLFCDTLENPILSKVFLCNIREMRTEHKSYLDELIVNPEFSNTPTISDETISEFFRNQKFNPAELSPEQVDDFYSCLQTQEWFSNSKQEVKVGIKAFIERVKSDCNKTAEDLIPIGSLMKEAWRLFGQFCYFMSNDSIKPSNKESALKEFIDIYFVCSDSVPERIKGIVTVLLNRSSFLDPFLSQRNILIEQYVSDFLKFRAKNGLDALDPGNQIHVRPWLANTLAKYLNFHSCHESATDAFAKFDKDYIYLENYGTLEPNQLKDEFLCFFSSKIEEDYIKPEIDDFTAQMTAALYPFRNGEVLKERDFEKINEEVFDVLKPFLEGRVMEFDNRLELYFNAKEDGNYSLNPQIFIDIRYLAAKYLELSKYYLQRDRLDPNMPT